MSCHWLVATSGPKTEHQTSVDLFIFPVDSNLLCWTVLKEETDHNLWMQVLEKNLFTCRLGAEDSTLKISRLLV